MQNASRILSAVRLHLRYSQEFVASRLSISQSQYNKIETGSKELPLSKFIALAAVFQVSPSILLEALIMGIEKPDSAVRKLISNINNRSWDEVPPAAQTADEEARIAAYLSEKMYALAREYVRLHNRLERTAQSEKTPKSALSFAE